MPPPTDGSGFAWRVGVARDARQIMGEGGENAACDELRRRGYAVVARRYRCRGGEIDVVARQGDVTVFVEVKTRMDSRFGGGAAAVTPAKQRTITRVALDYVARHGLHDRPCRFDVVVVDLSGGAPQVEVFANAFESHV